MMGKFKSLEGIVDPHQISSDSSSYAISQNGYEHTFHCFNHVQSLRTQFMNSRPIHPALRLICFSVLALIAIILLLVSVVCLVGSNEFYEKKNTNADANINVCTYTEVTKEKYSSLVVQVLEEAAPSCILCQSMWHFTTAAVYFSLFLVVLVLALIVCCAGSGRRVCLWWLLLLLSPCAVVPAIHMDNIFSGPYWVFFIPHLLLALVPPIALYLKYYLCPHSYISGLPLPCEFFYMYPLGYTCWVVGLILCILRLDGVLSSSFLYVFVGLFPAGGTGLLLGPVLFLLTFGLCTVDRNGAFTLKDIEEEVVTMEGDEVEDLYNGMTGANLITIVFVIIIYAGLFGPFLLRKDQIFHMSYHYTLIPFYVLILALFVALVWADIRLSCRVTFETRLRAAKIRDMESRLSVLLRRAFEGTISINDVTTKDLDG